MKQSFVIGYREYGIGGIIYKSTYAESAQEAVDIARYEWAVYEVVECYKQIKNWK